MCSWVHAAYVACQIITYSPMYVAVFMGGIMMGRLVRKKLCRLRVSAQSTLRMSAPPTAPRRVYSKS